MPRKPLAVLLLVVGVAMVAAVLALRQPFPSDRTPEGAYVRIAQSVADERIRDAFPYLETEAQWACFTIRELRAKAVVRVKASYPEAERAPLVAAYEAEATAADGPDVFVLFARRRGWVTRLRRDLSGVVATQIEGERATVVTSRGTRYPFRRRENAIWGLTLFTADLAAESQRAARDLAVVNASADDYDRAKLR